jgi:hypothetical protein
MEMTSTAFRPVGLFATAVVVALLPLFFDWRRRLVRRLAN